jgi:hypothetical protein
MKFDIEIFHDELTLCKLHWQDQRLWEQSCQGRCEFSVAASPYTVSVWFEPWGIKPVVRVNGIMVDYALAKIDQFDHKIDLVLDHDFYDQYHERDIYYRKAEIFENREPDPYVYDSVIGVGMMHQDLVDQIRRAIDAK